MGYVNDIAAFSASADRRSGGEHHDRGEEICRRLILARKLNHLDQREAAKTLGYSNSSQLSKIEAGHASVSREFIVRAAVAYGVSADYLLGLSNEPERDPRTAEQVAVLRSVQGTVEQNVAAMVTVLLKNAGEVAPLRSHLESLTQRISQLQEAYDKVCRKNEAFQNDVLAGSILESAVDAAGDASCKAKQFVERRSMIADFRTKAATDDGSYPLFAKESDVSEGRVDR
ncbi:helix-turn-helix protein [Collimonas sp. PA-H2]|nr:helix-turn-helix protein [Collimonas sp. PA-H2]